MLPFPLATLMAIVGVVEIAVGFTILAVAPRIGAYAASAWLLLVAVNLAIGGHFDVAVRDVVISIGAFALARLIEVGQGATARPVTV
jgi:xanthosine utilization system XapX-like protein